MLIENFGIKKKYVDKVWKKNYVVVSKYYCKSLLEVGNFGYIKNL